MRTLMTPKRRVCSFGQGTCTHKKMCPPHLPLPGEQWEFLLLSQHTTAREEFKPAILLVPFQILLALGHIFSHGFMYLNGI